MPFFRECLSQGGEREATEEQNCLSHDETDCKVKAAVSLVVH